jgi:hypothetical protein
VLFQPRRRSGTPSANDFDSILTDLLLNNLDEKI